MRWNPSCIFGSAAASLKAVSTLDSDNDRNGWRNHFSRSEFRRKTTEIIRQYKECSGCPGVVAAISIGGKLVYCAGLGYADVERLVPAHPGTVFRIASISKSLTSLLVGRSVEQGKLDLDEDVRSYVPEFPEKRYNDTYAKITIRSLLNHTSGIRSYKKSDKPDKWPTYPEMLLQTHYENTADACQLFQADDLLHKPGEKYVYSTYAFTLLSAALERACARTSPVFEGVPTRRVTNNSTESDKSNNTVCIPWQCRIDTQFQCLFTRLGLRNTYLDLNERIIPMRSSQYRRDSNGVLRNTPMVDNSYKWAGGGILSTAPDLIRLANHLCCIYLDSLSSEPIVSRATLNQLWTASAKNPESRWQPALGWFVARRSEKPVSAKEQQEYPDRLYVGHTGGAVGGTTVLLMSLPPCFAPPNKHRQPSQDVVSLASRLPPICVVVLTNLESATGISDLGVSLAELATDYCLTNPDLAAGSDPVDN